MYVCINIVTAHMNKADGTTTLNAAVMTIVCWNKFHWNWRCVGQVIHASYFLLESYSSGQKIMMIDHWLTVFLILQKLLESTVKTPIIINCLQPVLHMRKTQNILLQYMSIVCFLLVGNHGGNIWPSRNLVAMKIDVQPFNALTSSIICRPS